VSDNRNNDFLENFDIILEKINGKLVSRCIIGHESGNLEPKN